MNKANIRAKTKLLAKATMRPVLLKVVFILALEFITVYCLSLLANEIADRFFSGLSFTVWKYEIKYMHAILGIFASLMSLPLILGVRECLLKIVRLKEAKIGDIFFWYSDPARLAASVSYFIWIALYSAVSYMTEGIASGYIIGQLNTVLSDFSAGLNAGTAYQSIDMSLFDKSGIFVSFGLIILFFIITARFILIPFLMADDLKLNVFRAIGMSWGAMRGHTFEYLMLLMSFAGWFILTMLTAMLAGLYFFPYYYVTLTIFAEYVRSDKLLREKTVLEQETIAP